MDNTILYAIMVAIGLLFAVFPFAVFMGLGTLLGVPVNDARLLTVFFLGAILLTFGTTLGAFALNQNANCGSVKNMKQVSANAGIATAIMAGTLALTSFIPYLRALVTNLFPPEIDPAIQTSIGYGYYTFWASLFGTAIGGSLSAVC